MNGIQSTKEDNKNKIRSCSCVSGLPRTKIRRQLRQSLSSNEAGLYLSPSRRLPLATILALLSLVSGQNANKRHLRTLAYTSSSYQSYNKPSKYPYIPSWSADTCTSTRPAESWEATSTTLVDCCTKSFGWQVEVCVMKGKILEAQQVDDDDESPPNYRYVPDWSARTCYNDEPPPNEWVDQYNTLKECCSANFEWVLNDCLGDEAPQGEETELDPTRNYWYPLFSKTKCLVHSDSSPAPAYMLQDPDNELYPTFKTCCQNNFPQDIAECKAASRLDTPPTRPPATDSTLVVVPISFVKYYYPRYTENKCLYNGEEAPNYMKNDPMTYLSLSIDECCKVQFPLNKNDCMYNSGASDEVDDGFLEERWRDLYYPLFSKLRCINDNEFGEYMKDDPSAFFFTTIELCCSSDNFGSGDYEICLENSVDVNALPDEGDMEQQSGQVEKKVPFLKLDFGGRLYFQNVFIPSSNKANMLAVKNAILFAIESVFQASVYKIDATIGKNFDGIDLSGLRRLSNEVQGSGLRHSSPGFQPQRQLGKLQLFSFLISFTIECGPSCGRDGKIFGRQESLKVAEIFDDAIQDGSLYDTLKTSMDQQGLIGPFYSASLSDGVLLYEKAELDMNGLTFSPTMQPSLMPSGSPSQTPTSHPTKAPVTKPPTSSPTVSAPPTESFVYQFYPNYDIGTCVADGKQSKWEINLYDSLEECCEFPWLQRNKCLRLGSKPPTSGPTAYPTKAPITTKSPTDAPSNGPSSKNPTTSSPTLAPVTSSPSKAPITLSSPTVGEESTTSTTTTTTTTSAAESSPPTQRLSGKPTLEPCDNYWHLSIEPDEIQTCTNSLKYPPAWESNPGLKAKMLLDTPEQCCEDNFSGKDCNVIYTCGGAAESEVESPNEESGCHVPWHLDTQKAMTCSNNANFREEWPDDMFHETGEACCQRHFRKACTMIDDCPPPLPPEEPEDPNEGCANLWHMSTSGAKNTCTNDDKFPPAWLSNPNIKESTLFDTAELCCNKFFEGQECHLIDVCSTFTTPSEPDPADPTDCFSNLWHIATDGSSNKCINDLNFPAFWTENEHVKATQLFENSELCCETIFSGAVCHSEDICTGEWSSNGFYPVLKWPGCTNDNNPPEYMKGDNSFFFKTIENCCSSSNFEVTDYDLCLERSVASGPLTTTTTTTSSDAVASSSTSTTTTSTSTTTFTTPPPGDCDQKWHVHTGGSKDTCSNDLEYPDAWNLPQIAAMQLFETAEECCEKHFASKPVCHQINSCPPDEPTQSTETSKPTAASSQSSTSTSTTTSPVEQRVSLELNWEDKITPDFVKFEGIAGAWKIDLSQPCCRTGVAIHPPNLLPGEYSSMIIDYTIPEGGGEITFNYNMGMGMFDFLIDGQTKLTVGVPGGGLKTFQENLSAGDHSFTWKFVPPSHPNLPLSSVWIDNISIG